jgi:hypothetical protein
MKEYMSKEPFEEKHETCGGNLYLVTYFGDIPHVPTGLGIRCMRCKLETSADLSLIQDEILKGKQ